jgi:hypothetical protein
MRQDAYATSDTPCEPCVNLRRIYANAAAEYLGMLKEHSRATDPDSGLLEELVAAVRREIARGALSAHISTEHK